MTQNPQVPQGQIPVITMNFWTDLNNVVFRGDTSKYALAMKMSEERIKEILQGDAPTSEEKAKMDKVIDPFWEENNEPKVHEFKAILYGSMLNELRKYYEEKGNLNYHDSESEDV